MKIAPLAEVKDQFSAYVEAAKESPIVVTKNGKPVALLTPILEDDDLDSLLLAHNRRFNLLLEQARNRIKSGRSLTQDEFWVAAKKRRAAKAKL